MTPAVNNSRRSAPLAVIVAAGLGNALEFFSVTSYALVAVVIARRFFPNGRSELSIAYTFGIFGISYLVRPIGGLILGVYADRQGRKKSLLLSMQLMLAGAAIIAVVPTYAAIGMWAPILMLIARLLQGFAVGGEFGSATAFFMEQAPDHKKSLYASLQFASQGVGGLLSGIFALLLTQLSPEHMESWGWRLPFVFSLLLGPLGIYVRRYVSETPEFLRLGDRRLVGPAVITTYWKVILQAAATVAVLTSNTYFRVYLPTFATTHLGLPLWSSYVLTLISGVMLIVVVPLAAKLSERWGATRIMMAALIAMFLTTWPIMRMITVHASVPRLLLGCGVLSFLSCVYSGPQAWLIAQLFPTEARGTGLALSYNIGILAFGGFAPVVFTWLIAVTGTNQAPAMYILATGVVSLIGLVSLMKPPTVSSTIPLSPRMRPSL
jgi:MHS family proline/betaine transporter-like MFS transporter